MKKLLLTTALVGVAFVASPANAEVSLGLGGHFKGYVVWHDQDDDDDRADAVAATNGAAYTDVDSNHFDILRETEVHFTGETTLDNGLTVGFHIETEADGGNSFDVEESYAFFAGNWGRVNFGAEDGATYLLQVAAPSADSNVDGIRQYINPVNYNQGDDGWRDRNGNRTIQNAANNNNEGWHEVTNDGLNVQNFLRGEYNYYDFRNLAGVAFDYDHASTGYADKITYITPVFNGFQGAISYTPDNGYAPSFGVRQDDVAAAWGDAWELALRYEGNFNAVRLALGAGYSHVELEDQVAVQANGAAGTYANLYRDLVRNSFTDDWEEFNLGMNLGFGPFNLGVTYLHNNGGDFATDTGVDRAGVAQAGAVNATSRRDDYSTDSDTRTWVVGVDYTTGPFVLGASYYNRETERGYSWDLDTDRYSAGVTYTYGPGMTFRGSVHHIEHDVGPTNLDATSFLLGTQIGF